MGNISLKTDASDMRDILSRIEGVANVPQRATKALTAGAEIVLKYAKGIVPVRSGDLKNNLGIGRRKKTRDRYAVEVGNFYANDPYAPHAHLVEYGHGGPHPAAPTTDLQPAAEMAEAEVINTIMEELTKGL